MEGIDHILPISAGNKFDLYKLGWGIVQGFVYFHTLMLGQNLSFSTFPTGYTRMTQTLTGSRLPFNSRRRFSTPLGSKPEAL